MSTPTPSPPPPARLSQAAHAADDAFDLAVYCASSKAALRLPSALEEAFTLPTTVHTKKPIAAKTILKKLAGTSA